MSLFEFKRGDYLWDRLRSMPFHQVLKDLSGIGIKAYPTRGALNKLIYPRGNPTAIDLGKLAKKWKPGNITKLSSLLDDLIELAAQHPYAKGFITPRMYAYTKGDIRSGVAQEWLGDDALATHDAAWNVIPIQGHERRGIISYPNTGAIASEWKDYPWTIRKTYGSPEAMSKSFRRHELAHSLLDPSNYRTSGNVKNSSTKTIPKAIEEAKVLKRELLGKKAKQALKTPAAYRLFTYIRGLQFSAARNLFNKVIEFNVVRSAVTSTNEKVFKDGRRINVDKLINRVKSRPVKSIPIKGLGAVSRSKQTGFSLKRLANADTSKPILVDSNNDVVDGRHRVIKHQSEGHRKIKTIRVTDKDLKATEFAAKFVRIEVEGGLQHHYLRAKKWGHPAGRIEAGETPRQAAHRELIERTGYSADKLKLLGREGDTHVYRAGNVTKVGPPQTEIRWKKFSAARNLFNKVIEFKTLYVPGDKDEPPETLPEFKGVVDYTVQRHAAKRAGLHRDIRIGTKRHGLLSWASRKDLPAEGGKIAIHPQPIHSHSYLGWQGKIPEGKYGAGDVSTEKLGKALITKSTPTEVHATLADQREHHRLAFLKTARGWLLTRGKHPEPPKEAAKPKYKSVEPEKAHEALGSLEEGSIVQPKIDGSLVYVHLKNRPEIFSHRKSQTTGKNIVHTERFWHGRPSLKLPREYQDKALLGELYGTKKGKAVPPQELGGLLNANISESIRRQKEKGIKLKVMPFDLAGEKGSYPERLAKVKETLQYLPKDKFHAPEEANTPGAAKRLFEKIRKGHHSLTKEGVVVHTPHGRMLKIKNTEEANVQITGTYPGTGKFEGSHGGFTYKGGRVGTGFVDETRRKLHEYIGRVARIRHQGRYKSGAYRAPVFVAVDESK